MPKAKRRTVHSDLPPYVQLVMRRGRAYYYFRRDVSTGRTFRTALPGEPFDSCGNPCTDWWRVYTECGGQKYVDARHGTFAGLIDRFKASPEWRSLAATTQTQWSYQLDRIESEWGPYLVRDIRPKHILRLRDKYADKPAHTNNMVRALSSMLSWGVPRDWLKANPCLSIRKIALKGCKPYDPWPTDMISAFANISEPRLWWAASVALYTGQRKATA